MAGLDRGGGHEHAGERAPFSPEAAELNGGYEAKQRAADDNPVRPDEAWDGPPDHVSPETAHALGALAVSREIADGYGGLDGTTDPSSDAWNDSPMPPDAGAVHGAGPGSDEPSGGTTDPSSDAWSDSPSPLGAAALDGAMQERDSGPEG